MNHHRPDSQDPTDSFGATGHIEEWEHLALDLLDRTLPAATRVALDSHIEQCLRCREALDEQRRVAELLSAVPIMEPPARIERNVLRADRPRSAARALGARARAARRRSIMRTWLPAAAVLVIVVGAVATYQQAFPRGGQADLALKTEMTAAATESQDSGGVMSAAPAAETTSTISAADDSAATDQTTATAFATTADGPLSVSTYLDALPPSSSQDAPVVLLTMPDSGLDSSVSDRIEAITGLNPLPPVDSNDDLIAFAARADRTEIDGLIALLGEPGFAVFRFAERASELPPGTAAVVGDDPSVFPLIAATPGEGGGFALVGPNSDIRAVDEKDYVLVVITSSAAR